MRRRTSGQFRRGITLIDVLMASATLSFVVAAVCQAIVAGQAQSYAALREEHAVQLAEAMMEEVLAKPYTDPDGHTTPGPDTGESSRSLFDACDDFHNYSQSAGAVTDVTGALYPAQFSEFSRLVTAQYTTRTIGTIGPITGLSITISVTSGGQTWSIIRFLPEP